MRLFTLLDMIIDRIMYTQQEETFTFLGAGWYRIAELPYSSSQNLILSISKGYNTGGGSGAIVAIGEYYDVAKIQTLLPVPYGKSGITQIRVLIKSGEKAYLDVYYSETSSQYANSMEGSYQLCLRTIYKQHTIRLHSFHMQSYQCGGGYNPYGKAVAA